MNEQVKESRQFSDMSDYPQDGRGNTIYDLNEALSRRLEEESIEEHDEQDFGFTEQSIPMI